jgi:Ran GTPase-activating protein (RanGAP) involved in mRNA processing and transport
LVYGEPRRSFAQYEEFDNFDVRAENSATLRDCQVMCQDFLALGKDCSLQEFDMSDNSLNDQSFLRVAKGLFQALVSLTSLAFAHNEIGDEGAKAIASCLLNSPVKRIDLSDNRIGPSGAERLCECAMQHDALEELNLSSNQLEDEGLEYIASYVERTKSLMNLNIAANRIAHFSQLCDALTKNVSLKLLNVAANPIVDEDYAALQSVSSQSQTLDRIDMRVYELKPEDFDVSTTETSEAPLLRFK